MFKTRLLSGIVLVILALVFIITGNDLLLAVTGIISLIGLYELYRVFKIEKSCAGVVGGLATIVYYCNLKFQFYSGYAVICHRTFGSADVCICIFLSEISYRADVSSIFWCILCIGDAFLCISDQNATGWSLYCMVNFLMLLGLRYLCILCGCADWKTQDGTGAFSEEILGRSCWRSSGSSIINPDLLLCFPGLYGKHQP